MLLNHVGIVNNSEEQADRFYGEFLGFDKTRTFLVSADLSGQLFSAAREIRVLVFEKDGIKLEIFICKECEAPAPDYRHIGLFLENLSETIENAQKAGVKHIIGTTGEKTVHFLKDFSGNLIEIKQR
jgi:extradiol dioxygenase family protein